MVALACGLLVHQQRATLDRDELAEAQQSARLCLDELTRAIASAGAGLASSVPAVLVAHPYQVVFAADLRDDHEAPAPGTPVPGALANDAYTEVPAGYAGSPAELYRYTLDRTNDGEITAVDRSDASHYTLTREINGGSNLEIAPRIANPRVGEPLFRYVGDFDGDGLLEVLDRVDRSTSARVAAGAPIDRLLVRVEVRVATEAEHPKRGVPGMYRGITLDSGVRPRNLGP